VTTLPTFPVFRNVEPNEADLLTLCSFVRSHDLLKAGRVENLPVGAASWRDHLAAAFPDASTLPKGKGANKARQTLVKDADAAACKALGITRFQHLSDADKAAKAAAKAVKAAAASPAVPEDVLAVAQALSPSQQARLPKAMRDLLGL
jgi:hypothetical protein